MRISTIFWGTGFILVGVAIAAGWIPGNGGALRAALAGFLITVGALSLAIPMVTWSVMRKARPEDYAGTCPVGRVCPACSAFTFYPKLVCKSCGQDLAEVAVAGSKTEPL